MDNIDFQTACQLILGECCQALGAISPEAVEQFINELKRAERLSHLGVHCEIVGAVTEPAITGKNLLGVGSGSGKSLIPVDIAKKARAFGARIVHIGSNPQSPLKPMTSLFDSRFSCLQMQGR